MNGKEEKILLLIIVGLVVLRLASVFWVQGLLYDGLEYTGIARGLSEGKPYGFAFGEFKYSFRPPVYPFLLSILYLFTGPSILASRLFTVFIGMLGVGAMYFLGKKIYSRRVGLYSALVLAATPLHWFYSTRLMVESLLILGGIGFLYFLFSAEDEEKNLIGAIVLLPVLFMVKYTGILFSVFFLIFLFWKKRQWLKSKYFWSGIILAVLVTVPWMFMNYQIFGHPLGAAIDHLNKSRGFASGIDLFYLTAVPVGAGLFLPFVVLGYYFMWKKKDKNLGIFLLLFLVFFLSLSVLEVKNFRYLMPVILAFTPAAALSLVELGKKEGIKRFLPLLVILLVVGNFGITYYEFGHHPKLERYVSLEKAGKFVAENCKSKTIHTNVPPYVWWFAKENTYSLREINYTGGNICVLYDFYSGKDQSLIEKLERNLELMSDYKTARVYGS